nr:MAG: ORF1 [TTV-like mini virus]
MPYFSNWRWRRRPPWRRRRRRFTRRRIRRPLFPAFRRRHWVRRRRFRYRLKRKKLKKIKINQWQPQVIRKCSIKGGLPLFICGKSRIGHNYTLFKESIVPTAEPGGGAWSIMQLSLRVFYDQFLKYEAWWTKSNLGLPLVRYNGMKLTFYKSKYTSYVVVPQICPPMSVTKEMYLNCHPVRLLMNKHKIIIPKKSPNTKPYKKKWIHPPDLFKTHWYFQQDISNTPLILLHVSACSFEQPYAPENQISDNYTLYSLNTDFFVNNQFTDYDKQTGYIPKTYGTQNYTLWTSGNGGEIPNKFAGLIPLLNTTTYSAGIKCTTYNQYENPQNWGNPFYHNHSHPDVKIYYTNVKPSNSNWNSTNTTFTELHEQWIECRYNPKKDSGKDNKVFFKSNKLKQGTISTIPDKDDIIIENYPLWLIFWSWIDWLEKLKPIQHIYQDYYFVVQTPYIYPKRSSYLFLDWYFVRPNDEKLNLRDRLNWYPKTEMQEEVQYFFAESGPYTPKINYSQLIQANMDYNVKVKWGGCPAPMELITDPCLQDKFPIPNYQQQTSKIENPETPKETYLYYWDERRETITDKAAERIKQTPTYDSYVTGTATDPTIKTPPKEIPQTSDEEKDEEETLQQYKLLKRRNRQLLKQLHRLKPYQ